MLLREYAIKWRFVTPPHTTNVCALPGETLRKNCIFSLACSISALPYLTVAGLIYSVLLLTTRAVAAVWLPKSCCH